MVRIDTTLEDSKTIVSVAGRLAGLGVCEFLKICNSVEDELVLDLTGVRSADSEGISAIRELACKGAKLRGVSPFIRLLLEDQPQAVADLGGVRRHREGR
jgi:anti-anti-sigma regulatory factor